MPRGTEMMLDKS